MSYQSRFLVAYLEREFSRLDAMAPRMSLTRGQRALLFEGETPKLVFPYPAPVKVGHIEVLSSQVRVEVTAIRRTAKGEDSLVYTLYNDRIGQRFLAVQDGQNHPEQYAHSGGSGVDPQAGEALDAFTQRRLTEEAKRHDREAAGELIAAAEDLRSALKERIESNPQFMKTAGRDVWLIRSKLDRLVSNAKRRAA